MSDRVIVSLAAIPMISGALLLLAFQRAPAPQAKAAKRIASSAAVQGSDRAPGSTPWVGVVVAGNTAELAADQAGRVTDVWLEVGARVEADQPILQIDSSDAADALGMAGAELGQKASEAARAAARLQEAESKLRRLRAGGPWIAEHEIEQAQTEVRMAAAELRAAEAAVRMGRAKVSMHKTRAARYRVSAPFAGTLVSCDVDPGDSVSAGQVLARVSTDDRHVRFAIPPDQAPQDGELEVVIREPRSGRAVVSKLKTLKPEVDTSAQLVFATAPLSQADSEGGPWLPGMRVEVLEKERALQVWGGERVRLTAPSVDTAPPFAPQGE